MHVNPINNNIIKYYKDTRLKYLQWTCGYEHVILKVNVFAWTIGYKHWNENSIDPIGLGGR